MLRGSTALPLLDKSNLQVGLNLIGAVGCCRKFYTQQRFFKRQRAKVVMILTQNTPRRPQALRGWLSERLGDRAG